jgi:hypothetical protein
MKSVTLTEEQATVLEAFCESFDMNTTGVWRDVERGMREQGIVNPDQALSDARAALRGE